MHADRVRGSSSHAAVRRDRGESAPRTSGLSLRAPGSPSTHLRESHPPWLLWLTTWGSALFALHSAAALRPWAVLFRQRWHHQGRAEKSLPAIVYLVSLIHPAVVLVGFVCLRLPRGGALPAAQMGHCGWSHHPSVLPGEPRDPQASPGQPNDVKDNARFAGTCVGRSKTLKFRSE